MTQPSSFNIHRIKLGLTSFITLTACLGTLLAILRRDWRVLPLVAWFLVTLVLLYRQQPLFLHHLVALNPPLIALSLLALARPSAYQFPWGEFRVSAKTAYELPWKLQPSKRVAWGFSIFGLLVLALALIGGMVQDSAYYQAEDAQAANPITQQMQQAASDLRQYTKSGDLVITDGQFVAALADRSTPPWLVDTSSVRLLTGSATLNDLELAALNPQVHAVLFYTSRLYSIHTVRAFHAWVAARFHLVRTYSVTGQELWVR